MLKQSSLQFTTITADEAQLQNALIAQQFMHEHPDAAPLGKLPTWPTQTIRQVLLPVALNTPEKGYIFKSMVLEHVVGVVQN